MPTPQEVMNDPKFQAMSPDAQRIVLGKLDPNFSGMSPEAQNIVLQRVGKSNSGQPAVQNSFGNAVREFSANVGAPERISDVPQGIAFAVSHPVQSAKLVGGEAFNAQKSLNQRSYQELKSPGIVNKTAGAIHWLESGIPFAGPALARAGDQFAAGNWTGGLGGTLGIAAPIAIGKIAPTPPPAVTEGWRVAAPTPPPGLEPVASHETIPRGNPIQRTVRAIVGTGEGPMKRTASKANLQYAQDYADVKTANAALAERAALEQKTLSDSAQLAQKVQDKAKAVRAEGSAKYDAVSQAVTQNLGEGAGVPANRVAELVNHAQDKILAGSHPEAIRQFNNILQLEGEQGPIQSSMGAITPGSPLYQALVERGAINPTANPVVPFRDLGGYVTELGSRMYDAKNLGDVYSALKYVRDGIQNLRQEVANQAGAGKQLTDANQFWARYEATYNRPQNVNQAPSRAMGPQAIGNPVSQVVRRVDPQAVRDVVTGKAGQRLIDNLSAEDPELGKLAQQIRDDHATVKSTKGGQQKPLPEAPNLPDTVEAARKARIEDWVEKLRRPTVRSWEIGAAVTGLLGEIFGVGGNYAHAAAGTGLGMLGTLEGLAQIMEKPSVVKWLTKPTARDMAILNEMNPQGKVAVRQAITQSMVKNHVPLSPEMKGFLLPAQAAAIAAANAKNNYSSPEDVMMAMKNGDLPQQEGNRLLQRMRGKGSIVRPMEPPK